ncbi:hypothetical protein AB6A40_000870 [Gnathostoma spinigerum]|uniref:Uncharacterized protein n=1 Tax=Gnathostoma spinigerum TaxID=75299 RepID=A0ABD6E532_9BILA
MMVGTNRNNAVDRLTKSDNSVVLPMQNVKAPLNVVSNKEKLSPKFGTNDETPHKKAVETTDREVHQNNCSSNSSETADPMVYNESSRNVKEDSEGAATKISADDEILRNATENRIGSDFDPSKPCQAVLCVTPADTVALVLTHDVVVEITLHKHVRICRIGGVAATICRGGRVAAVHHPYVEIVQQETQVLFDMAQGPQVRATGDSVHVLGIKDADSTPMVHSITKEEVLSHKDLSVAADRFRLRRDIDATVALFLDDDVSGDVLGVYRDKRERCILVARQAIIDQKGDQLSCIVQGVKIKHNMLSGDTRIYCGRNFISLCVKTLALTLHSPWIDINVDRCARTRLRRGDQIIETSGQRLLINQNNTHADFMLSTTLPTADTDESESAGDERKSNKTRMEGSTTAAQNVACGGKLPHELRDATRTTTKRCYKYQHEATTKIADGFVSKSENIVNPLCNGKFVAPKPIKKTRALTISSACDRQ